MQMMKYQGQLQSCKETVDGWKIKSERMLASGGSMHNLPLLPPIDIEKFTPKFKVIVGTGACMLTLLLFSLSFQEHFFSASILLIKVLLQNLQFSTAYKVQYLCANHSIGWEMAISVHLK